MSETTQQLAKKPKDIRDLIAGDNFRTQVAMALPKHITPDRFIRVALTALTRTPKLMECTRESLLRCMMDLSAAGLEPDGRHAHLIPYGKECTLVIDYKGIIAIVRRDPAVADVQCFTIRQNDSATWENGVINHTFQIGKPRGEVIATYTKIVWADGRVSTGEPFEKEDAERSRKSSKSGNAGPWKDHYTEMWKKSNIRRDSKMWSLMPEILDAIDKDDDRIEERVVTGREVPTAKVPDVPLPHQVPAMFLPRQSDDLTLSADEPTASERFWSKIQASGLNRDAVEDYLVESEVIQFPADLTDEIAAGLLPEARFSAIVKALGGAA